jgi:hypothetical protein
MQVYSKPAQKGYTFACSRKAILTAFEANFIEWISFGAFKRHFEPDKRSVKIPKLTGTVVASLTFSPKATSYLILYEVSQDIYGEKGKQSFTELVIPKFRDWLAVKVKQVETADSHHKEIIVEWDGKKHTFHELRYLYVS